ncbi:MAG: GTPase HflX [Myxacorys californica WJT36-NPBG1]|jgi:GTP-binding protein HflX|nr:GTPase HflX [Myxacorys californica WJT36-NPBG1]
MATVYGDLQGLKSSQIKQLEQLYQERLPSDRFITPEFAEHIAALSQAVHHPLCCYVNRRGQVIRVGVGKPMQTQLSESDLPRRSRDRLSGIRCLVAQFQPLDASEFIAMIRQRLDALVVLRVGDTKKGSTHSIQQSYLAHIVPDMEQPWQVESVPLEALIEQDADDLIHEWESDVQASGFDLSESQTVQSDHDRALLVGLQTDELSDQQFQDGIDELVRLVESAAGEVVGLVQQKRSQPHPQTVVGQGKIEEITLEAQRAGANLIVFNQDISATQARNLEEQIGVRVVDRTEVILDIFAQRARSQAGKLQVELAQLEYLLPRLRGRGQAMSRLGAGIGTRGPGETKLETERRTIQRRIAQLQQEVNQLQAHRARLRDQRDRQQLPTIALVGYTNAGKSTLLNVLTRAEVYTADQLFATLDPTTRRLTISNPNTHELRNLLLTDTVGFIHHLPPALMDAFRATLEEVTEADGLLHILDLSHPAWAQHLESVETVLSELPAIPPDALLVFNKIDLVDRETLTQVQQMYPDAVFISAIEQIGLDLLQQRLVELADTFAVPKLASNA